MKARFLKSLLLTALTLTLATPLLAQGAKDELAKLEGTWVGGVRSPAGKAKEGSATMVQISELTIKDGKITSCKDGKGVSLGKCTGLTVNPATTKTILRAPSSSIAGQAVTLTAHLGQELVPLPEGSRYLGFIFARTETPEDVEAALRDRLRDIPRPQTPK